MPVDNSDYLDPDRHLFNDEDESAASDAVDDGPEDYEGAYDQPPELDEPTEGPAFDSAAADLAYDAHRERQLFGRP